MSKKQQCPECGKSIDEQFCEPKPMTKANQHADTSAHTLTKCAKCGDLYGRHRSAHCLFDGEIHIWVNTTNPDALIATLACHKRQIK